jgi:hypothetical protein
VGPVILLSLTASLNPTLLAATTGMLLLSRPARLMRGYLLGALITSITLGPGHRLLAAELERDQHDPEHT